MAVFSDETMSNVWRSPVPSVGSESHDVSARAEVLLDMSRKNTQACVSLLLPCRQGTGPPRDGVRTYLLHSADTLHMRGKGDLLFPPNRGSNSWFVLVSCTHAVARFFFLTRRHHIPRFVVWTGVAQHLPKLSFENRILLRVSCSV